MFTTALVTHQPLLLAYCLLVLIAVPAYRAQALPARLVPVQRWYDAVAGDECDKMKAVCRLVRATEIRMADVSIGAPTLPAVPDSVRFVSITRTSITGSLDLTFLAPIGKTVQLLDLSRNDFTGTVPARLAAMTELRALSLAGNRFEGELPDLSALTNLRFCRLQSNERSNRFCCRLGQVPLVCRAGLRCLSGNACKQMRIVGESARLSAFFTRLERDRLRKDMLDRFLESFFTTRSEPDLMEFLDMPPIVSEPPSVAPGQQTSLPSTAVVTVDASEVDVSVATSAVRVVKLPGRFRPVTVPEEVDVVTDFDGELVGFLLVSDSTFLNTTEFEERFLDDELFTAERLIIIAAMALALLLVACIAGIMMFRWMGNIRDDEQELNYARVTGVVDEDYNATQMVGGGVNNLEFHQPNTATTNLFLSDSSNDHSSIDSLTPIDGHGGRGKRRKQMPLTTLGTLEEKDFFDLQNQPGNLNDSSGGSNVGKNNHNNKNSSKHTLNNSSVNNPSNDSLAFLADPSNGSDYERFPPPNFLYDSVPPEVDSPLSVVSSPLTDFELASFEEDESVPSSPFPPISSPIETLVRHASSSESSSGLTATNSNSNSGGGGGSSRKKALAKKKKSGGKKKSGAAHKHYSNIQLPNELSAGSNNKAKRKRKQKKQAKNPVKQYSNVALPDVLL